MPFGSPILSKSRPKTSDDQYASLGTKRRFPLLRRKKNKHSDSFSSQSVDLDRPSTALPHVSTKKGFRVHVEVRFESPLESMNYSHDYDASPKFVAPDRVCQGLLSRLQHCSTELITRHDVGALDPLTKPRRDPKALRYRISYRVERDGACLIDKLLRSFQDQPLSSEEAREVIAATDRIVALFLLRHDPGFKWVEAAEPESFPSGPETVRPCTGRPQSTYCVPRARFIHATQSHELVPGYSVELFLRSRCSTRYPESRNASLKVDSTQGTPLPVLVGEDLMSGVAAMLDGPINAWKRHFDQRHSACDGLEGSGGCHHVEDGAVDIMFKVRNNLGPDYTYFSHRIQTSKVLFNDPQARDFDEFTEQLKAKLEKARDATDRAMNAKDDLIIRVRDLRGEKWHSNDHLVFRLDGTVSHCRQTIEALMERLHTGISDVFEGHDVSATLLAHKRGHLIFDGVIGGFKDEDLPQEKFEAPELEKKAFESRLRDRIRADITMVCKDTCSLDSTDVLPNLGISVGGSTPSIKEPYSISDVTIPDSPSGSRHSHLLAKKHARGNLRETHLTPGGETRRVPSGVEMAKQYGYMADYMAEEENYSEPPSTPSLADTDSISPHDSILATPQRNNPRDHQGNTWLRMVGGSDIDPALLGEGVSEHGHEPDALGIGQPLAAPPTDKASPNDPLETPPPTTVGTFLNEESNESSDVDSVAAPSIHESVEEPRQVEATPAEESACEGVLKYTCEPASPIDSKPAEQPESPVLPVIIEPAEPVEQVSLDESAVLVERVEEETGPEPVQPVTGEEQIKPTETTALAVPSRKEAQQPQDAPTGPSLVTEPEKALVESSSEPFMKNEPEAVGDSTEAVLVRPDASTKEDLNNIEDSEEQSEEPAEVQAIPDAILEDSNIRRPDVGLRAINAIRDSGISMDELAVTDAPRTPEHAKDLSPDLSPVSGGGLDDSPPLPGRPVFTEKKRHASKEDLLETVPETAEAPVIPRPLPLQSASAIRPKSTALTVRTPGNPFFAFPPPAASDDASPIERPGSAMSNASSSWSSHRRQVSSPSVGFLGLNEPRHLDIGLRNVIVPYHLRAMHSRSSFGSRPGSSQSDRE